jgi:hypothetical protein
VKVGIVVDGSAESQALRLCFDRNRLPGITLLAPLYAEMQPRSTPQQMARAASQRLRQLEARDVDRIVVLVDREVSCTCPVTFSADLEDAFSAFGHQGVKVVIKDYMYENWLISDVAALRSLNGVFDVTKGFVRRVSPNKADHVQAPIGELNRIIKGNSQYHKNNTAKKIAEKQTFSGIAANSRSFRRFLRVVSHPSFADQSKSPQR